MADQTISVRLPEEKVRRLRHIAARDGKTLTDVVEESLDAALASDTQPDIRNSERLAYAIGCCASGGTDVSKMDLGDILLERYQRDGHL